jgi:hypothetical protein
MNRVSEISSVDAAGANRYLSGARGEGELVDNYIKVEWRDTTPPGFYFIVAEEGGTRKAIGKFEIPRGGHRGRIFVPVDAEGSFFVAGRLRALSAERTISLFTRSSPAADLAYDPATTSLLGEVGTRLSCICRPRRERAQ